MARLVRHDETSPLKLEEQDLDDEKGNIAICRCGLSAERPFCDGTHRLTEDEMDGTLYRYDENLSRRIVTRES